MRSPPPLSTRQSLLVAAVDLFLRQGFDTTSMDQVRSAAGASNGSLYHHFPTKNHLARALYEDALGDYQANLLGALDEKLSARDGVHSLVKRHIAWVLRSPRQARALNELRAFTALDGQDADWALVNAEAFSALKSWIARHVAEGAMQDLPFEVWMALVFAPVMQLTSGWSRQERRSVPARVRDALMQAAWKSVCETA